MNRLVFLGKVFFLNIHLKQFNFLTHAQRGEKTFINLYRKINKHEKFTFPNVRFFFAIPRVVEGIAYLTRILQNSNPKSLNHYRMFFLL